MGENFKPMSPDDLDDIICDEIPDRNTEPELYDTVFRCMIHGLCGYLNLKCVCMKRESVQSIIQNH